MNHLQAVVQMLGGASQFGSPRAEMDFVPIIEKGFKLTALTCLQSRTKISQELLFRSLGIAKRTGARRLTNATRLKPVESERALRLARVFVEARDVLGDEDKALHWLSRPNRALGGAVPLELISTGVGFQGVMDVLGRIDYGVYS